MKKSWQIVGLASEYYLGKTFILCLSAICISKYMYTFAFYTSEKVDQEQDTIIVEIGQQKNVLIQHLCLNLWY